MKSEGKILILLSVFCLIWGYFGLSKQISRYESEEAILFENPNITTLDRFFHFSPAEQYIVEMRKEIWPGIFTAKNPISPAALPLVYKKYLQLQRGSELSVFEIHELREWSVLANTQHINALRMSLLDGVEKEKNFNKVLFFGSERINEPCSLRNQDRAVRLIQVNLFNNESEKFLQQCNPDSLDVIWFQIERESQKKNPDLGPILARVKSLMSKLSAQESFQRWYLLEIYNLAHILETRLSRKEPPQIKVKLNN